MNYSDLQELGWQPFFQQQLNLDEWQHSKPARVVDIQRSVLTARDEHGDHVVALTSSMPGITVGDWLLLDHAYGFLRLLERATVFKRKAAGSKVSSQLVAANIDTVFIVCSVNQDFSLNRIERYLTLAHEARVEPVVVLSKIDLSDHPDEFISKASALDPQLAVVPVNGLDPTSTNALRPWCELGKTVALLGSSGVGKSTLVNTLLGINAQATAAIRNDDDEGRHTTTSRSLHRVSDNGWLLDTPGMRELQLIDCEQGIENAFSDITELALRCKFYNCNHLSETGCAVTAAIEAGELEARRLSSFRKLMREQILNSATLAQKRSNSRKLGKMIRKAQYHKKLRR